MITSDYVVLTGDDCVEQELLDVYGAKGYRIAAPVFTRMTLDRMGAFSPVLTLILERQMNTIRSQSIIGGKPTIVGFGDAGEPVAWNDFYKAWVKFEVRTELFYPISRPPEPELLDVTETWEREHGEEYRQETAKAHQQFMRYQDL